MHHQVRIHRQRGKQVKGRRNQMKSWTRTTLNGISTPRFRLRLRIKMLELLRKRKSAFARPTDRLGKLANFKMRIQVNGAKIRAHAPYRSTPRKRALIREAIHNPTSQGSRCNSEIIKLCRFPSRMAEGKASILRGPPRGEFKNRN